MSNNTEWRSGIDNRHKGSDDNPILIMFCVWQEDFTRGRKTSLM